MEIRKEVKRGSQGRKPRKKAKEGNQARKK